MAVEAAPESSPAHHAGKQGEPNPSRLSTEINKATRDVHDTINRIIMHRVALGLRDIQAFREGILSFFYIYKTFEAEWLHLLQNPPTNLPSRKLHILRTLHSPHLLRTESLLQDLAFYYSLPNPAAALETFSTPATSARAAYVKHIQDVIRKEPLVIIAYAHNMYLALFAGGKVIRKRMIAQGGGWLEGGMEMFKWEVQEGKEDEIVRGGLKKRLAETEAEIEVGEWEAIISESREIFIQNGKLIEELDILTRSSGSASLGITWLRWILMALVSFLAYRIYSHIYPGLMVLAK